MWFESGTHEKIKRVSVKLSVNLALKLTLTPTSYVLAIGLKFHLFYILTRQCLCLQTRQLLRICSYVGEEAFYVS